jgi:Putative ABC-transporter type IV
MFPIYGLSAYLFEPVHDALRERPWWERAVAYSVGIMGVEYLSGSAIKRLVGAVPWDYSGHGRFVLPGGATRLDYAPLWAVAGLALERMHDAMDNVTVSDR